MSLEMDHVNTVCQIGNRADTCRYLAMGPDGFECLKLTAHRPMIDQRVEAGQMVARGDHCDGVPNDGG
tara:strand:- start:1044 stop:1247 length:204 start_codon:yes stop_codon:yes gene_type:complete